MSDEREWDYCKEVRLAVTRGNGHVVFSLNGKDAPRGIDLFSGEYVQELREGIEQLHARDAAVAELIEATQLYLDLRGTTHGQIARNRLKAALAACRGGAHGR